MVNSTEQAQQHVMTSATRQPTLEGPAGNTRTRSDDTAGERQAAAITIAAAIVTGTVRGQLCVMARNDDVRAAARGTEDSGDVRSATVIIPERGDISQFGASEQHAVTSHRGTSDPIIAQIFITTGKLH